MKIAAVHLLDDYSGSPRVFSQSLMVLREEGNDIDVFTGGRSKGFISDEFDNIKSFSYCRTKYKLLTLIYYILSQFILFFYLSINRKKYDLIYVNTLLPFGAAIAGKLFKIKVVYHLHEVSISPKILHSILCYFVRVSSYKVIYVSKDLEERLNLSVPYSIIYNCLSEKYEINGQKNLYTPINQFGKFNILMVCSLKSYKGVYEFITLADMLIDNNNISFTLVLNAESTELDAFLNRPLPTNMSVYFKVKELGLIYADASVVLNLSRIDEWVETFGLTILEAIAFGIPVIVPPVGGPIEIIENGKQGYFISSTEIVEIKNKLEYLYSESSECEKLSLACKQRSLFFSNKSFRKRIICFFDKLE